MPPKKAKKQVLSLGEFLVDDSLGSWADEMDALPNARKPFVIYSIPSVYLLQASFSAAARLDDDPTRPNDRFGRRGDDFLSSKPDRGPRTDHHREDVPLPTNPPFTAFIGNLSFDTTEAEMEDFFGLKTKSVKIIKDRDDKPKGFGYVEFVDLEGLKEALTKSNSQLSGRTIRVSVAEPPKERSGAFGRDDDGGKFDSPWRRDGPLPELPDRDSSRRRFDGPPGREKEPPPPSVSDGASDWRSSRARAPQEPEPQSRRSRGPAFGSGAADQEESWSIGSKFKPSAPSEDGSSSRFGSLRGRGDMGPPPPRETTADEGDWRRPRPVGRSNTSPTNSTPATPQMGRRKLELLPRSGGSSVSPSPLASPKGDRDTTAPASRANPFGAAKPVDVSNREKVVQERLEKDREVTRERLTMSRTNSRQATERPSTASKGNNAPPSPRPTPAKPITTSSNVKPSFSFAAIAKRDSSAKSENDEEEKMEEVETVQDKLGEVMI